MSLTDDQLEMLESYVDGELPAGDEDALRQRLEQDSALASALEQLRGERELRAAVWQSYEPDAATVARLVAKVDAAVDRHTVWAYRLARYRVPFAAAACVLIGFMVGWLGRGSGTNSFMPAGGGMDGGNQTVVSIPAPVNPGLANATAGNGVELPIYNENNQQVGVQRFKSVEDAARFIEDLTRWQKMQEQIRQQGNVNTNGSEKF